MYGGGATIVCTHEMSSTKKVSEKRWAFKMTFKECIAVNFTVCLLIGAATYSLLEQ